MRSRRSPLSPRTSPGRPPSWSTPMTPNGASALRSRWPAGCGCRAGGRAAGLRRPSRAGPAGAQRCSMTPDCRTPGFSPAAAWTNSRSPPGRRPGPDRRLRRGHQDGRVRRRALPRQRLQAGGLRGPAGDEAIARQDHEPGAKQVFRGPAGDVLALRDEPAPPGYQPLLVPVMRGGQRLTGPEPLRAPSAGARATWPGCRRRPGALRAPAPVPVQVSPQLEKTRDQMMHDLMQRAASDQAAQCHLSATVRIRRRSATAPSGWSARFMRSAAASHRQPRSPSRRQNRAPGDVNVRPMLWRINGSR